MIRRLLYLTHTRSVSEFVSNPQEPHTTTTLCVLRYLKGCPDLCLFFPSNNQFVIKVFSDLDWGTCIDSRRSITDYLVIVCLLKTL